MTSFDPVLEAHLEANQGHQAALASSCLSLASESLRLILIGAKPTSSCKQPPIHRTPGERHGVTPIRHTCFPARNPHLARSLLKRETGQALAIL